MSIAIESVSKDGVSMIVKDCVLYITGNVIGLNPGEFMEPFLLDLHNKLIDNDCKSFTVDLTNLTFLNSAGIRALVYWILLLEEMPEEKKYIINILYSSKMLWQESSVSTLVFLNPDLITKKIV